MKLTNEPLPLNSSSSDNRDRAFQVWYACGMNDSACVRELKKLGFAVTRQTISDWKKKYCWGERASAIDSKKAQAADTKLAFEDTLLEDMMIQKRRYDDYFETIPKGEIDNQAMFAYGNLCKQIIELTWKKQKNDNEQSATQPGGISIDVKFIDAVKDAEIEDKDKNAQTSDKRG